MKKIVFLTFALVFFASLTSSVYSEEFRRGRSNRTRAYEKINLSEEQRTKLEKMNEAHFKNMESVRTGLRAATEKLREEIEKEETDMKKVSSISDDIKSAQAKILDLRTEHVLGLKEVLTPDQFRELNELKRQRGRRSKDAMYKGSTKRARDGSGRGEMQRGRAR